MNTPENVTSNPLLFDRIIAPLEAKLDELKHLPLSRTARKLHFDLLVKVLLFRIFAQIESLRTLATDLSSSQSARVLNFPVLGLSTLHDGFVRYPVTWFAWLSHHLAKSIALVEIGEVAALGKLWCVDSSFWPVVSQLGWLRRQDGIEGVRLHLGLSLNTLCPAVFVQTTDKSPTVTERACLMQMLQAGVTYIADRGYVDLLLYLAINAGKAFFVIRQRKNLGYEVVTPLKVMLDPAYAFLLSVTDQIVTLKNDSARTSFRLVQFVAAGHTFWLLTNRFDLTTEQVIVLYAWRWQVELIFRAWKHTFKALHLINLSEAGIEIQFHILLIASLLWTAFHQTAQKASPSADLNSKPAGNLKKAATPTGVFGTILQVRWRLSKPLLRLVCNCLAQPLSFYLERFAELRL